MLAEITAKGNESWETSNERVEDLVEELCDKYPLLKEKSFTVAVDMKVAEKDTKVSETSEVALLPPFAGG